MNCADCLDVMLDADPAELRGDWSSELGEHLRGCPACRARANAVIADTRMLGRIVRADMRIRASARRRAVIAGAAAAGIILAFAVRAIAVPASRAVETRAASRLPSRVAITRPRDTAAVVGPSRNKPSAPSSRSGEAGAGARRILAVAIQPSAFVAVPIHPADPATSADQPPVVSVRPLGGRRAAVFRVAESTVTVVWLY